MPGSNIIRLRALLSEKFSGLRLHLGDQPAAPGRAWATGLKSIDSNGPGGLPRGALSEIVSAGLRAGGATLLQELLRRAAAENQIVAVIDGNDALDVTGLEETVLARLLWVRVRSAEAAVKAADLIFRDGNFPLVLLDLQSNAEQELRRIPATTWYRFQRVLEDSGTVGAIFTRHAMIAAAQVRVTLHAQFGLAALDWPVEKICREMKMEVADSRHLAETTRENVA